MKNKDWTEEDTARWVNMADHYYAEHAFPGNGTEELSITKLEFFTAQALQGILANSKNKGMMYNTEDVAELAVSHAQTVLYNLLVERVEGWDRAREYANNPKNRSFARNSSGGVKGKGK